MSCYSANVTFAFEMCMKRRTQGHVREGDSELLSCGFCIMSVLYHNGWGTSQVRLYQQRCCDFPAPAPCCVASLLPRLPAAPYPRCPAYPLPRLPAAIPPRRPSHCHS